MSISIQVQRLQTAKTALKLALNAKGCTLTDELLDEYATALNSIQTSEADYKALIEKSTNSPVLPAGITKIGDGIFKGITNLTYTQLPETITFIGKGAFELCTNWSALTKLPDNLIFIDDAAFNTCSALAITALSSNLNYIGSLGFYSCASLAIKKIPRGVTVINISVFNNCSNIRKIWIPATVTSILTYNSPYQAPFLNCGLISAIYCEAASKPAGWQTYWNYKTATAQFTVNWGISESAYDALG